ncbi:MAG: pyruvate kinase [Geminicoccaceae bacterium]
MSPLQLLDALVALRAAVVAEAEPILAGWEPWLARGAFTESARNLAHYLALRHRDLRPLQDELMILGLSSLGRLEGRVLPNLDAVLASLAAIAGAPPLPRPDRDGFQRGEHLLNAATEVLLGPAQGRRQVRILVTCPSEAADDPTFFTSLAHAGADAVRINCAHDDAEAWRRMVAGARRAEALAGRRLRILMDLAGPKIRTDAVRCPPERDRLVAGERLLLCREGFVEAPGAPEFQVTATLPELFDRLEVGHRVLVDDGRFGGTVDRLDQAGALIVLHHAGPKGARLKPEKGLNFPDTELAVPAMTEKDEADLDFVAHHADLIGLSFVQTPEDVVRLQAALALRRPDDWQKLGLIAKIETPLAVRNLPAIIVRTAGSQPLGVMIARGDLAVEIGFERLAEMQEEIMWLAEAAHVPVIWATQVLESLVKKGLPSRGDMTDAAMASRAECVMLNKGPFVLDAVHALDRLLARMAEHHNKKMPRLRALKSW